MNNTAFLLGVIIGILLGEAVVLALIYTKIKEILRRIK